jgi:peptidyl-prolyl cis-trans isomerase D
MQRHKKYLVITIWISTIAFVGAGFVGWGAYDLNKDRASSIAKVGHRTISVQEFQTSYSRHFSFYSNLLGGKMTQEQAEQMSLDQMVINTLVNQALLLNLADDIGLISTKEDVKERLAQTKDFQTNGAFDKGVYYALLKQNGISPKEYENGLEKEILNAKLERFFTFTPSDKERELFTASFFLQDRLSIASVTLDANELAYKEEELKSFWENNKANYVTQKSFTLELLTLPASTQTLDDKALEVFYAEEKHNYKHPDGKLMSFDEAKANILRDLRLKNDKKHALETYLAFKKGEIQATQSKTYLEGDTSFPLEKIESAAKDEVVKPFIHNDNYVIVKVKEIKFPEVMSYEMAKERVSTAFLEALKVTLLEKKAQGHLEAFQGMDIGFVGRDSVKSIAGLDEAKSAEFLSTVFDNANTKGYKVIGDKAILYEVLEQKLLDEEKIKQYVSLLDENIVKAKLTEFNQNLIKKLAQAYKVEQYYKGK